MGIIIDSHFCFNIINMQEKNYSDVSSFLKVIPLEYFPLTEHYLNYDDCYKSNSWIGYTIYWENNIPVVVIGERKPMYNTRHILIVEINKDMQGKGYGTKCLLDYMKKSSKWELVPLETAECFYKKLKFVEDKNSGLFVFGDN